MIIRTKPRLDVWVVRHGTGWIVLATGVRPKGRGATQRAAIAYARSLAKAYGSELLIQNRHGRIRARDSHGHDPYPPKG